VKAETFWHALNSRGFTLYSGVPDSTFKALYGPAMQDAGIRYIPAVREDAALGVASAAYFAGTRGAVLMQNSGLGNIINPLTSFNLMYRIPVLLVIGWRGYQGKDAPEHLIMGEKTTEFLDLLRIPYEVLEEADPAQALDALVEIMDRERLPGAVLVREGVIS